MAKAVSELDGGTPTASTPGPIVRCRNRDWVLLPSDDPASCRLRPLTGATDETIAVHRQLMDLISFSLMEERIRSATERTLAEAGFPAQVHLSGATAETMDLRDVTQCDFRRVSVLSLSVILLVVAALLRDVLLSLFMVAATVAGYLATLGVTSWVFGLLGSSGVDWEVEVFLFIVMVAVGQDYNIFFAVWLAQESQNLDVAAA